MNRNGLEYKCMHGAIMAVYLMKNRAGSFEPSISGHIKPVVQCAPG